MNISRGNNRSKIINELISLQGWHKKFGARTKTVELKVDIGFKEGRFTTSDENPISFVVRLKRAVIVVWHSETENCTFITGSEYRGSVSNKVTRTELSRRKRSGGMRGAKPVVTATNQDDTRFSGKTSQIDVNYWHESDRVRKWHLIPTDNDYLLVRPWDANQVSQIKVKDNRKSTKGDLPPAIMIGVLCDICDIEIDLENSKKFDLSNLGKNKLLACQNHLKHTFANADLSNEVDFDITFGTVKLADIIAGHPQ